MTENVKVLVEQAKELRNQLKLDEALSVAKQATEDYPYDANSWWQLSLTLIKLKHYAEAKDTLHKLINLEPHFSHAWFSLGEVYEELGKQEDAIWAYEQGLEENPDDKWALNNISYLYQNRNQIDSDVDDDEVHVLTRLDSIAPLATGQLNRLGLLHYQKNEFYQAIKYWERGVNLNTGPYFLNNLALAYSKPDIGRTADAVDLYRLASVLYPDYEKAKTNLNILLQNLNTAPTDKHYQSDNLITPEQWYSFYINPFELLNAPNDKDLKYFNDKIVQKLKKNMLQEIELEDGQLPWLNGLEIDKSKALSICEDLFDDTKKEYHWIIFRDKPLLTFLTRGTVSHFRIDPLKSQFETLNKVYNDTGFIDWLSTPFSKQYDHLLSLAFSKNRFDLVMIMLQGRRYVSNTFADRCFISSYKAADKLLLPLRNLQDKSVESLVSVEEIRSVIRDGNILIIDELPIYFRDLQNEIIEIIINIGVSCYNKHNKTEESKRVFDFALKFNKLTPVNKHRLEENLETIKDYISEERKKEVFLTIGKKSYSVTKDFVTGGDKTLSIDTISGIRWGVTVKDRNVHDCLVSLESESGDNIDMRWLAQNSEGKKLYESVIDAILSYVLSSVYKKFTDRLQRGERLRIGSCTVTSAGVSFEKKGWFMTKQCSLPWSQVGVEMSNGELIVYDKYKEKDNSIMGFRESINAPLLMMLVKDNQ
ncbi:tetratricopeptide repeat protein [Photobacterium rosenbergii]|uniref:tetratricopeptide repeat protein n=1 Tax=Photobacterium rosenbergii TaxID=294936 RepID=UPI001C98ECA0|nr:tetratricopeptide repeat protein [Photobacterium rosenbergii]MBY5946006.1 tetratricopeptide repeat protein [Photobacterium rosenbergii]